MREGCGSDKNSVAVIYTHFPHYRQPVFDALSKSSNFDFHFYFDSAGIEGTILSGRSIQPCYHEMKTFRVGPFFWQSDAISLAFRPSVRAFIFLGNPFVLSTWVAAFIARTRGVGVFFWTHGWVRNDTGVKERLRVLFYRLANGLLLYGDRAKRLGIARGFRSEMLHVIGNSLDYESQAKERDRYHALNQSSLTGQDKKPFFLVVARLVESAGIELAIEALAKVAQSASLVVVGDGPCRTKLEELAVTHGVDVQFRGALYCEEDLCSLFMNCVAVVSPGKIGLLAMHALAYGAAIVTHRDADRQMPEFEAIQEGLTGVFFEFGNVNELAAVLKDFLDNPVTTVGLEARRRAAITTIEGGYTPQRQVELIEEALRCLN